MLVEATVTVGKIGYDAFGPNSDISKQIESLKVTLSKAESIIERSECWGFKYPDIKELLPKLTEAVYEAKDIIDEFESRKRVEASPWWKPGNILNKFNDWLKDIKERVKNDQGMIDQIWGYLENICNNNGIPQNPNQFSKTARPITVSRPPAKFCGREKELDDACGRLLGYSISGKSRNSTVNKRKIPVLPIVGIGGIGKTTLGQMVSKRIQSHFHLKIWICVTEEFDLERMLKEIIQCATGNVCDFTNLDLLEDTLINAVKSKRVLLVLDDIWSTDWQQLLGPMNETSEGSAIILTTRYPDNFIHSTEDNMTLLKPISLEAMEENKFWEFFRSCAGLKVDLENYYELEPIAIEISQRLKGSPLAAKTLGGALQQRIDKNHWTLIRDSKMWEVEQDEGDIMPVLRLSYLHLSSRKLKKCLLSCSMFPKDHKFTPRGLATFWIMSGLITKKESLKSMEDEALGYFYELENRGFFDCVQTTRTTKIYVMHDLMHDVCLSLKGDEYYCPEDEAFENVHPNMHHMFVRHTRLLNAETPRKLGKPEKLHTLLVASDFWGIRLMNRDFTIEFKSLCDKFKSIRCLILAGCRIKKIYKNIENLKLLQYLDISNTDIKILPQSFCNLNVLEYLDMRDCHKFLGDSGFPSGCNKLTGLRYFRPPVHVVPYLIDKPNLMSAMQLWDITYDLGSRYKNKIENLKHLTGVRGFLEIKGLEHVSDKKAAEEAELNKLQEDELHLHFGTRTESAEIHDKEVLEGLCPHSNLEVMEIHNYNGSHLPPSWMGIDGLPKLRKVKLDSCWNKTLSQLPRYLTELGIFHCHRLESLETCLQPDRLPNLRFLEIGSCKLLKSLPVSFCRFASLEKLVIWICTMLTWPQNMAFPSSIKSLDLINGCGELENSISSCLQNLTSLEVLTINYCSNIVSIPNNVMRNLTSLRRLDVSCCENLESLGDEEFLQSIDFTIKDCPKRQITWGHNPNGGQSSAGSPQVPVTLRPGVQTRAQTRRLSGQGVVIGGVRGEDRVEEGSGKGKEKVDGKKAEEFANLRRAAKKSRAQRFNKQNQVSGRGQSSKQPISNTDNTGEAKSSMPYKRQITQGGNPNGGQLWADALAAAAASSSNAISEMALIDQTPTTAQGAPASAAPSAPPTNPSLLQSIEIPTTDYPSSSNPRKRKADAQN